jgi:hypothetical protein
MQCRQEWIINSLQKTRLPAGLFFIPREYRHEIDSHIFVDFFLGRSLGRRRKLFAVFESEKANLSRKKDAEKCGFIS